MGPEVSVIMIYRTPISILNREIAVARYLESKASLVYLVSIIHLAVELIIPPATKGTPIQP